LRLGLLYLFTLVGMATCLIAAGMVLSVMLRWLLGDRLDLTAFINAIRGSFSVAIPFAVIWRLYRKQLLGSLKELNNPALMRLYRYIMALGGNIATFTGGVHVLFFIAKSLFLSDPLGNGVLPILCNGLAGLAIGLPVWLISWNTLQSESAQMSEDGDFARRSTLRKVYLYLVLFLSVAGVMGSAGEFLYLVFNQALGYPNSDFKLYASESFFFLALVAVWLIYHLGILRQDGKQSQQVVAGRHAAFPVLVLTAGESAFTSELVHQLGRVAPHIPVAIHDVQNGAPDKELLDAKAIVLPGEMALQPFEALRLWLNEYKGRRLIAPENSEKWFWSGFQPRKTGELAHETAQNLRQMAEGQSPRSSGPTSPWVVVGYIFGGLFALQILFVLVILATSGGGL
jgi:hypothetical protein